LFYDYQSSRKNKVGQKKEKKTGMPKKIEDDDLFNAKRLKEQGKK